MIIEKPQAYSGADTKKVGFLMLADLHYKKGMYAASAADVDTILGHTKADHILQKNR